MDKLKEQLQQLLAPARAWFDRLSGRERRLVSLAGGAVALFVVFLVFLSFSSSAAAYRRRTADKQLKLQKIQGLAGTYRDAQQAREQAEAQLSNSNVRLITYVEERARNAGLEVPTMTPKADVPLGDGRIVESALELTFTDVDLRRLTDFLGAVERGPGVVKVKFLRLEPRPSGDMVTAWTTVATYRLKQQ